MTRNRGFASATQQYYCKRFCKNFLTKGNYAELFEQKDSLFIVKKALAITIIGKDSMFVHGDTMLVTGPLTKESFVPIIMSKYSSLICKESAIQSTPIKRQDSPECLKTLFYGQIKIR